MQKINLKNGKSILVDDDDFERVKGIKWYFCKAGFQNGKGYAYSAFKKGEQSISMHRLLIGCPVDRKLTIDHINGDPLDNRKENLRFATARQQRQNSAIRINNHSGFKGISKRKNCGTFKAEIMAHGKRIYLGDYKTEREASEAYGKAAIQHYQEFARV